MRARFLLFLILGFITVKAQGAGSPFSQFSVECNEQLAKLAEDPVKQSQWTADRFVEAFENLRVPVVTANSQLVEGWEDREVWKPYWESVKDYCLNSSACQELLTILMAPARLPDLTPTQHRQMIEEWARQRIPGYTILWEPDYFTELTRLLAPYGQNLDNFKYGKDGRGALPDFHYHLLLENKFFVVGNHHDVLGHLLLFSQKDVREFTEKLAPAFADAVYALDQLKKTPDSPEVQELQGNLAHSMRLFTYSWNLAQEKIYFSDKDNFAMMGAFNTNYNAVFSSRLDISKAERTAGSLGFFSKTDDRLSLIPSVELLQEQLKFAQSPQLNKALENYAQVLREAGLEGQNHQALGAEFEKIVKNTLFAQWGPFRVPMKLRWKRFGRAIKSHPVFSRVFEKQAMLKIAAAQLELGNAVVAHVHAQAPETVRHVSASQREGSR